MSDWSLAQKLIVVIGIILAARLLRDPIIELIATIFDGIVCILQKALDYLVRGYQALAGWTYSHITSRLTFGQAITGIFVVVVFTGFAYANYRLLTYSLEVWLPEEIGYEVAGLTTANITAMAFITLEVVAGFFIAELLDISKLIDISRWPAVSRRIVFWAALFVLAVLTIIECATAVGRQLTIAQDQASGKWPAVVMGLAGLSLPLGTALVGGLAQHALLTIGAILCGIVLIAMRILEIVFNSTITVMRGVKQVLCALVMLISWPFYLMLAIIPNLNDKIDDLWTGQIAKLRKMLAGSVFTESESGEKGEE